MTFKLTNVQKLSNEEFIVTGDLSIRDIKKSVDLKVPYNGEITDPWATKD